MSDIQVLIDFVKFTHEIRRIRRAMMFEDDIRENDMEHQYQMALTALFIIDIKTLKLDKYKCMAMSMVHDIVEVYAGDTIAFAPAEVLSSQAEKERLAAEKLNQQWPDFISLRNLIKEYEERQTPESKFVYALDKLIPIVNNYLFDGKAWKDHGVTFEKMKSIKVGKINTDPSIDEYYQQLLKILDKKPEIFGKTGVNYEQ